VSLELAIVDQDLVDRMRERIGVGQSSDLGVLDALTIRRYARAVGETNPLYYDAYFARSHGYADIIAPPNLLVSVLEWSEGSPNEDLRIDGTEPGVTLPGLPESGYRLMGGGEDMTFYEPVYPGQRLSLTAQLTEVTLRVSRSGPMAVAKLLREYFADGALALASIQTILVR
jgi:acyl dehydratase